MTKTLHWSVPVSFFVAVIALIIAAESIWPKLSWGAMFWAGWIASVVFHMMWDRADQR